MHKCTKCGNTTWFDIYFQHRRFGSVPAEWLEANDDWEPDWDKAHEDDGDTTLFPEDGLTCATCGSQDIQEHDSDDADGQIARDVSVGSGGNENVAQ